jgi:hypothetical protein
MRLRQCNAEPKDKRLCVTAVLGHRYELLGYVSPVPSASRTFISDKDGCGLSQAIASYAANIYIFSDTGSYTMQEQ